MSNKSKVIWIFFWKQNSGKIYN